MKSQIDWSKWEVSDARFEQEGVRTVTIKTANLGGRADLSVYLPPDIDSLSRVPVVVLLHGAQGSHWAWTQKGGAHRTALRLAKEGKIPPMVLAMPSDGLWGDGTGYVRHERADYEAWIAADVPAATQHLLPEKAKGGPQCIAGLSMGGFAALRLGAKHGRRRYLAMCGLSSATKMETILGFVSEPEAAFVGAPLNDNLLDMILANRDQLPALRFDCGTRDMLLHENRQLHHALDRSGIKHDYEEFEGGHDWAYWEKHLADALLFFAAQLGSTTRQGSTLPAS